MESFGVNFRISFLELKTNKPLEIKTEKNVWNYGTSDMAIAL